MGFLGSFVGKNRSDRGASQSSLHGSTFGSGVNKPLLFDKYAEVGTGGVVNPAVVLFFCVASSLFFSGVNAMCFG